MQNLKELQKQYQIEVAIKEQNLEEWLEDVDNLERIDRLVESINKLTKEIKSYGIES